MPPRPWAEARGYRHDLAPRGRGNIFRLGSSYYRSWRTKPNLDGAQEAARSLAQKSCGIDVVAEDLEVAIGPPFDEGERLGRRVFRVGDLTRQNHGRR